MDEQANRLAHYLRERGVGPDVLVGLCVERSLELIVGMLGILKAGGAYVPLDPAYPPERLAYMLDDISAPGIPGEASHRPARVLLTQAALAPLLPPYGGEVICLDRDWDKIEAATARHERGAQAPVSGVQPDHLAYVIFTSGSTGRPKGTLLHHRGLCNVIQAFCEVLEPQPGERALQFFSPSFDGSLAEIFTTLVTGGALCLAPREVLSSPPDLWKLFRDQAINMATMAPAMWGALPSEGITALRAAVSGGEGLPTEVAERWAAQCRFTNGYGPTETTVIVSAYTMPDGGPAAQGRPQEGGAAGAGLDHDRGAIVPIGRPTRNCKIYLLDAHLQPVPIGVPGELYIAGMQLARGYLHRPDLTAAKFVPDPFAGESSARMYKSGDLARYLPDGNIEFLGRIDQQVKIRGFRIELGEIESVLEQQPGVRQAVVVPREDEPGEKRLVAYVVLSEDAPGADRGAADKARLLEALQAKLPSYMVPAALVFLDAIPMTPNGKVDRRALPAPDWGAQAQTYVAARTPIEGILVELWKQVLGVERVGIQDSFFDLGGHSLLATQLVSRVQQALRVELPLRELFERPTVAELAERVEAILRQGQGLARPPIEAVKGAADLPLSYAQQRMWFLDQLEPNTPLYNIPGAFRFQGALDLAALRASVDEIVARHDVLRATFPTVDGRPRQVIAPRGAVEVPLLDLAALPEEEREREALRLAEVEASAPFDLARGPLLRVQVLRLAEQEHLVLLTMHHIVSDGWSGQVFVRELGALYQAYHSGAAREVFPLSPLEVQYADYARWQQAWLQGDVLEKQRAYWLSKLAGAPPTLDLPTDHPRPALQSWHGEHLAFDLDEELVSALRRLGRAEGATLFMTLLAAFKVLLYRYSGQADISVGTPIANRNHPQIEGLIGFFVNTLVMRDVLDGQAGFRDLLQQVRETALGAYMHQDVPFEMLVDALQAERDTSHTPLFQVMFALQSALDRDASAGTALPGLVVEPVEVNPPVSMFDLTLVVSEDQERLRAGLEYNSDLWDAATIERMAAHFRTLLAHLVADPDRPILALPWLADEEREQVVARWNDTDCAFASPAETMHQLFEHAAARSPQATALVYRDRRLTYAALNARANRLARDLIGRGVRPETLVGLCAERSVEMVVGLLGILKAGGAYVPLDPAYPAERLAYMIRDSGLRIVVSAGEAAAAALAETPGHASPGDGLQIIALDESEPSFDADGTDENPLSGVGARNAAYVIYTSGSTGQPKGVVVEHGSVVNHNLAAARLFRLTAHDRILQFSTINFDAAVEEMFPAWAVGATVVLRPGGHADQRRGAAGPGGARAAHRAGPAHGLLARVGLRAGAAPGGQRAGAPLPRQPAADGRRRRQGLGGAPRSLARAGGAGCGLDEHLRPDGGHDHRLVLRAGRERRQCPPRCPSVGPLPNVRLYILDSRGEPVPVGVPGELCIAGAGVARGYLNRPDLTAERFRAGPLLRGGAWPGASLYHTGDLARFLPDGNIEFLGRNDDQVKIRGFRVELGEIERALKQRDDVRDAVVVAREGATPGAQPMGVASAWWPMS